MTTLRTPEQIAQEVTRAEGDVAMYSLDLVRECIVKGIETDRAQRDETNITTHDSRCTLDSQHDGPCNVKDWRG